MDGKPVRRLPFTRVLMLAMDKTFQCISSRSRTTNRSMHRIKFYGVSQNTIAAAMAFEMCFNLILHWGMAFISDKRSYTIGLAQGLIKIADAENWARKRENEGQLMVMDYRKFSREFLAAQKRKSKKSKEPAPPKDPKALKKGEADSKKIDLKRKWIEDDE